MASSTRASSNSKIRIRLNYSIKANKVLIIRPPEIDFLSTGAMVVAI